MISKCCSRKLFKDYLGHLRCSECLLIAKPKRTLRLAYIALFSLLFLSFTIPNIKHSFSSPIKYTIIKDSCKDVELNDDSLLYELIKDSCILPNIAIAQIKIETNYYKSYKCIHLKNLFGIKEHGCKYTKGTYNYTAIYSSYKDCIKDYCEIQKQYLKNIDNKWAQNPDYCKLITKIKN